MNGSYPTIWSSEHRCLTQAPTISFHLTFKQNTTQHNGTEPSKRTSKRKHEIYTGYGKHLQHSVTGDFKKYNFFMNNFYENILR